MKKNLLILFDCDETLWFSDGDYVSSVESTFVKLGGNSILRLTDGKKFILKKGVKKMFKLLSLNENILVGIVSDNKKTTVLKVLKLFGLLDFLDPAAISVKLWKGYCPKFEMILEILEKPKFKSIQLNNVYWIDDKDYSKEAQRIGVNFIKVGRDLSIAKIVRKLIG